MSNSKLENQKAAVKQWFKDTLNVDSPREIKAIIKEFCDYTGFEAPRASRNKEIRQSELISFIAGYQHAEKVMYSEEEVKNIVFRAMYHKDNVGRMENNQITEWFNNNKKQVYH